MATENENETVKISLITPAESPNYYLIGSKAENLGTILKNDGVTSRTSIIDNDDSRTGIIGSKKSYVFEKWITM